MGLTSSPELGGVSVWRHRAPSASRSGPGREGASPAPTPQPQSCVRRTLQLRPARMPILQSLWSNPCMGTHFLQAAALIPPLQGAHTVLCVLLGPWTGDCTVTGSVSSSSWTGTCTVGLQGPATEDPETPVRNWDSRGGDESCGQISRTAALGNRTLGCLAQRKPERGRQGVPQGPHHVPALLLLPSPSSGPGGGSSPMVRCGPVGSVTAWWQPGTQRLGHVQPPGPRAAAQGFQEPTCKRRDRHLTPRLTT